MVDAIESFVEVSVNSINYKALFQTIADKIYITTLTN